MVRDEVAEKIAESLLQIRAVKLAKPVGSEVYTWASGWKSPIYCDNRITLSYPKIRTYIRQQLVTLLEKSFGKPDVIAGVATGAIAQGVLVAEAMGLPFIYVRPQAKAHGMGNQIEGELKKGQRVVVIEDLISTGKSSLAAVEALRAAGAEVKGMVAIFTYGFDEAKSNFKKSKVSLVTLSNYDVLIQQAVLENQISEKDLPSLKEWRKNPSSWGQEEHSTNLK